MQYPDEKIIPLKVEQRGQQIRMSLDEAGKLLHDVDENYTGGRNKAEIDALELDPAKKAITSGFQNEAKIGLDLEDRGIIGHLERSTSGGRKCSGGFCADDWSGGGWSGAGAWVSYRLK